MEIVPFLSVVESTGKENVPLLEVVVLLLGPFCEESTTCGTTTPHITKLPNIQDKLLHIV